MALPGQMDRSRERPSSRRGVRHDRRGVGLHRVPAPRQAARRLGRPHAWRDDARGVLRERVLAQGRPAQPSAEHAQDLPARLVRASQAAARPSPAAAAEPADDPASPRADGRRRRRRTDDQAVDGDPPGRLPLRPGQGPDVDQPRQGSPQASGAGARSRSLRSAPPRSNRFAACSWTATSRSRSARTARPDESNIDRTSARRRWSRSSPTRGSVPRRRSRSRTAMPARARC